MCILCTAIPTAVVVGVAQNTKQKAEKDAALMEGLEPPKRIPGWSPDGVGRGRFADRLGHLSHDRPERITSDSFSLLWQVMLRSTC